MGTPKNEAMGLHDVCHRGHWYGQDSVSRAHLPLSLCKWGDHNVIDPQIVQTPSCCDDVYDGVNCTHLMEMNSLGCGTMRLGFGFRYDLKDFESA